MAWLGPGKVGRGDWGESWWGSETGALRLCRAQGAPPLCGRISLAAADWQLSQEWAWESESSGSLSRASCWGHPGCPSQLEHRCDFWDPLNALVTVTAPDSWGPLHSLQLGPQVCIGKLFE